MCALFLLTLNSQLSTLAHGQQPQTSTAPVFSANAKYVQGIGPGYWPTAGSGLTLNIAAGTAYCGNPPAAVQYASGTLTMTDAVTNYVFLDPAATCAPASNTTGFLPGQIPLAKVVTAGGVITSLSDARTWFVPQPVATDSQGGATASLKKLNNVRFADQFPGSDACAKIGTAIQDLPSEVGAAVSSGTGLDDATSGGTYTGTSSLTFTVIIDGTGSPNTFKWYSDIDPLVGGVAITGSPQTLSNGVTITFGSTTGHTMNDRWNINVTTGGVVDARGMEGPQNCASNPLAGGKGGVTLLLGATTFNSSVQWTVTANGLSIFGLHENGGTKIVYSVPVRMFDAGGFDSIRLENIYFDGGEIATNGLRFGTSVVQEIALRNLKVYRQASGTGLDLGLTIDSYFERIDIQSITGATQIGVSAGGADNHFYSCRIAGMTVAGLDLTGSFTGSFYGCIWSGNAVDIRVSANPGEISFVNCWFENSTTAIMTAAGAYVWTSSFFSCLLHTFGSNLFDLTNLTTTISIYNGSINGTSTFQVTLPSSATLVMHHVGNSSLVTKVGPGKIIRQEPDLITGSLNFEAHPNTDSTGMRLLFDNTAGGGFVSAAPADATKGIVFATDTVAGNSERMRIRADGNVKVGIAASGAELFGVAGNIAFADVSGDRFVLTGVPGGVRTWTFQAASDTVVGRATTDTLTNKTLTSPVINAGITSSGAITLTAGGTNQNITLAPSGTGIVLANNLYAQESRPNDVVLTGINDSSSGDGAYISTASSNSTEYALAVLTNATTNTLYVRADNRVGIGTNTPGQRLDVSGSIVSDLNSATFSATPAFDASLGNTLKITLAGNVTSSTLSNASAGQTINFLVCQDATGSRTFVWPTNVKGGMTVGGTASTCSAQGFIFDGTNAYAVSPGVTNM